MRGQYCGAIAGVVRCCCGPQCPSHHLGAARGPHVLRHSTDQTAGSSTDQFTAAVSALAPCAEMSCFCGVLDDGLIKVTSVLILVSRSRLLKKKTICLLGHERRWEDCVVTEAISSQKCAQLGLGSPSPKNAGPVFLLSSCEAASSASRFLAV